MLSLMCLKSPTLQYTLFWVCRYGTTIVPHCRDGGNNRIRMRKGRLSLREAKRANLAWHLHLCNLEPEFIWDQNNTSRNNNIGNGLSFYGDSCPPPLLYVIALSATAAENNKSILKLLTDQVCQKRIGKRSTVRSGHFDQPVIQM